MVKLVSCALFRVKPQNLLTALNEDLLYINQRLVNFSCKVSNSIFSFELHMVSIIAPQLAF